jgi:hypothetical protein
MMMGTCFAMLLAILALGCAGTAGTAVQLGESTAKHAAGWTSAHYAEYVKAPSSAAAATVPRLIQPWPVALPR